MDVIFHKNKLNLCVIGDSEDWVGLEGNVLFNDALNTFYIRLYGIRIFHKNKVNLCVIGDSRSE